MFDKKCGMSLLLFRFMPKRVRENKKQKEKISEENYCMKKKVCTGLAAEEAVLSREMVS